MLPKKSLTKWKKLFKVLGVTSLILAIILALLFWLRGNLEMVKKNTPQFTQEKTVKLDDILIKMRFRLMEPKSTEVLSPTEFVIWLKDGLQVVMSSKKDIDSQLDSLQLILSRATIEGEKTKKIDLRFDKPVLTK